MRHFKSLILVAIMTLSLGVAQAQKVAHVNLERVVANMPEFRALQTEIAKISKTYKDDIDSMKKKLQAKVKKYQAEQNTQTEAENQKRAQEVQNDNTRIVQSEQAAYQELQEKNQKGLIPILKKAEEALKAVAKSRSIQYVMDSSGGKGLLIAEGDDLYNAMKVKLGLLADIKPKQPQAKK